MEFAPRGDLTHYMATKTKTLNEEEKRHIFRELAAIMKCLRDNNIVHRDLKPDNILLFDPEGNPYPRLKICDFGLARVITNDKIDKHTERLGTEGYKAPEISSGQYNAKVDLWSLGVIFHQVYFGTLPKFDDPTVTQIELPKGTPKDIEQLLQKLLKIDPNKRIEWDEFYNLCGIGGTQGPIDNQKKEIELLDKSIDDMPESPKFTIYHNSLHSTDKTIEEKKEIKKLLLSLGSLESDIKEVDLARDFELAGFIKAKGGGQVPILGVLMRTEIIGDVQLLKQKIESGEILKMLKDDASQIGKLTPQELQLGILDRCLEGAESLFSVLNLLNPLSWLGWNSKIKPTDQVAIEFEVIHTNWYWRCLRRLLRFHGTYFLRIHPKHHDVRAHHYYSNIASITLVDSTNAVFRYKDGSSPDFIRCPATDLKKMINLISSRCQETKIIQ